MAKENTDSSDNINIREYYLMKRAYKPGVTTEEIQDYYSNWVEQYDDDSNQKCYLGPYYACKAVIDVYPHTTTNRNLVKILDVACGTGLVGERLKEEGFTNIDGLDPSQRMLDFAQSKDVYNKLYCEYISEEALPIDKNMYDCIVISGGFGEGHIPCAGVDEMIRIVKPGGFIIIAMQETYLTCVKEYAGRLEPFFLKLEEEERWIRCSRTVVPKYFHHTNGVVFKYKVC